jgi:hypothetical protein
MKNISAFSILMLLVFGACKKDNDTAVAVAKRLVGFSYEETPSEITKIEYDSQGRVTKFVDTDDVSSIAYTANEVQIQEWRNSENRQVLQLKGKLNIQGNIYEANGTSEYTKNIKIPLKYSFEYNASGYMTRQIYNKNNGETVYEYQYAYNGGNLSEVKVYLNGVYDRSGIWEYDPLKIEKNDFNSNHFGPPNQFTGKINKNLAVKYTGLRPDNSSWWVTFNYNLDQEGYPVSCFFKYWNGNTSKILYDYQ